VKILNYQPRSGRNQELMIEDKVKLSLNMTRRQDDSMTEIHDVNDNKTNNNENEANGNNTTTKKKASPIRSLDLPKYGAIRKSLSPEKFIVESPVADIPTPVNEDAETTEFWSKLRCGSLRTEEVAEREKQKQERMKNRQSRQSSDYPGLAFGSAMFGSDTTMKFNIIKNELHNIMRSQLKRVDGEMNAFSSRVKEFDKHLEESESYIRQATAALSEVVSLQAEERKSQNQEDEDESNISAFDQHVLFLETQLRDAKMKASQSFQILEDCDLAQESLFLKTNPSLSSRTPTTTPTTLSLTEEQLQNIANGNNDVVSQSTSTTKEMEENIANGNISQDITNGNTNHQDDENVKNGNVVSRADILSCNSLKKGVNDSQIFNRNSINNSNVNCINNSLLCEDSANANLPSV